MGEIPEPPQPPTIHKRVGRHVGELSPENAILEWQGQAVIVKSVRDLIASNTTNRTTQRQILDEMRGIIEVLQKGERP